MATRVIDAKTRQPVFVAKAHSGEIMSVTTHENAKATIIASCARDRTVQCFAKIHGEHTTWSHIQTLDDHTASVSRVRFMENGTKLLSCSADRTVVIRELVIKEGEDGNIALLAFIPTRTITLKSAPVHIAAISEASATLLVSTTGRQVHRFDVNTGRELHVFKATDDSGESVALDALALGRDVKQPLKSRILAGIATTDKSIRLYDMAGNFIDKEWGHTEGVTDVAMLETIHKEGRPQVTLVSTGTDGTVMMWSYEAKPSEVEIMSSFNEDATAAMKPLRKVLSKAEMLEMLKSPERNGRAQIMTERPSPDSCDDTTGTVSNAPSDSLTSPRRSKRPQSNLIIHKSKSTPKINTPPFTKPTSSDSPTSSSRQLSDHPSSSRSPKLRTTQHRASRSLNRTPSPPDSNSGVKSSHQLRHSRRPSFAEPTRSSASNSSVLNTTRGSTSSNNSHRNSRDMMCDVANANTLAEQMTRSLRLFRRRIEGSQNLLRDETRNELESEIQLTMKSLVTSASGTESAGGDVVLAGRGNNEGEEMVMMKMLGVYSEKLMVIMEEKMRGSSSSSVNGISSELVNRDE